MSAGNVWAWGNTLPGETYNYITVTCGSIARLLEICVLGNMDP